MKLGLAHSSFKTEQQAVVEECGMIDAIGITNERIGDTREINEPVPIGVVAGEP